MEGPLLPMMTHIRSPGSFVRGAQSHEASLSVSKRQREDASHSHINVSNNISMRQVILSPDVSELGSLSGDHVIISFVFELLLALLATHPLIRKTGVASSALIKFERQIMYYSVALAQLLSTCLACLYEMPIRKKDPRWIPKQYIVSYEPAVFSSNHA